MKIGIIGDVHFSTTSSIVREMGNEYSKRLEHCILSMNWAEEELKDCDLIVQVGDFFDRSDLTAMEITAFSEIKWNDKPHIVLCGNHEMGKSDLSISSAHLFKLLPNFTLITKPTSFDNIFYLPYSLDPNLDQYNGEKIIISHNDIKGINYGGFVTKHGIDIEDINCFFINGHLHNGSEIKKGVFNIGNFVGQNFSEDAFTYEHRLMILDTETLGYTFIENPYSFNFYKVTELAQLDIIKPNAVVTVKSKIDDVPKFKDKINANPNILYSRVIADVEIEKVEVEKVDLSVDHIQLFRDFILGSIGEDSLEELEKI